jgi:CO/xanthine dehydrogenase FAD-binding subunit
MLRDEPYDDARMTAAVRSALDEAEPLSMNAYKVPLARALTEHALRTLGAKPSQ